MTVGVKINIMQAGFTTLYSLLWSFFSPDLKKWTLKPFCEPFKLPWAPRTVPATPSGQVISRREQLIPIWVFILFSLLSSCPLLDQCFWGSTTEQRTLLQILESVSRRWSRNSFSGKGTALGRDILFFFFLTFLGSQNFAVFANITYLSINAY